MAYFATGPVTAAKVEALVIRAVVKGADESVTSSTTLQNDDALTMAVAANTTYLLDGLLMWIGNTTGEIKFALTSPTGSTVHFAIAGPNNAIADGSGAASGEWLPVQNSTTSPTTSLNLGASTIMTHGQLRGTLITGANAGSLTVQWAQQVSNGTATTIKAGSWMRLHQVVAF
jgi:hypothetical protein